MIYQLEACCKNTLSQLWARSSGSLFPETNTLNCDPFDIRAEMKTLAQSLSHLLRTFSSVRSLLPKLLSSLSYWKLALFVRRKLLLFAASYQLQIQFVTLHKSRSARRSVDDSDSDFVEGVCPLTRHIEGLRWDSPKVGSLVRRISTQLLGQKAKVFLKLYD